MLIFKEFSFDSAHFLPKVPDTHKCRNVHGHTYKLKVSVSGEVSPDYGWVVDFSEIKEKVGKVVNGIDHRLLNDIDGLENPTSEVLVVWLWNKIKPVLPGLIRIELSETPGSGVIFEG